MRRLWLGLAAVPLLQSCGGGDGGGGSGPPPLALPAPSPTPSPAPAPAPTPTATPDPGGAQIAGTPVPGTLFAPIICSAGQVTRSAGRVTDIGPGGLAVSAMALHVESPGVYLTDFNGFGGPVFGASSRLGGQAFEVFAAGGDELQIAKALTPLEFATYGIVTYGELCFFTAATAVQGPPPAGGQRSYDGFADGLVESGGDEDRLYGSTASLTHDGSAYRLELRLRRVEEAFAEPAGQAQQSLGTAQARLTLANGQFQEAVLTGPAGYTGRVSGSIGGRFHLAAMLIFELTAPDGSRIWGVVAADGAQI